MRGFSLGNLAVVLVLVLFSCSQDEEEPSNNGGSANANQETIEATSFAGDEESETIYICLTSNTPFESVWSVAAGDIIKLPLVPNKGYNFIVDWGDNSEKGRVTSYNAPDAEHTYESSGEYTIKISGAAEAWSFREVSDSKDKIVAVTNLGDLCWRDFAGAFKGCTNLVGVSGGNTSQVTDMSYMFADASQTTPDTSGWDTSQVTDMQFMFEGATEANPDTSGWVTANVTNMSSMFEGATAAIPTTITDTMTSVWDTSNVVNMQSMFEGATVANPDTSGWVTANVTNMSSMFERTTAANPDTSSWVTEKVTDMNSMFMGATVANPDTSSWVTEKVTDMNSMFMGATVANPDTSSWVTEKVTDMNSMFMGATAANPDTSGWVTEKVTDMNSMFMGATAANPDTSSWVTEKVTDMNSMFKGVEVKNSDDNVVMRNEGDLDNVDMSNWSFAGLKKGLEDMFIYSTLQADKYAGLLKRLDSNAGMFPVGTDKVLNAGCSQLDATDGDTTGEEAKANLIANDWRITDRDGVDSDSDTSNGNCNAPN